MFEVKAIKKGFYNKLQREGVKFSIEKLSELGSWMKLTEKGEKQKAEADKKAEAEVKKAAKK